MTSAMTWLPSTSSERLQERYTGSQRLDRSAGIIRGVKVIGRTSRNGRSYSDNALRRAVPMYEGMKVNIDHRRTPGDRPVTDRFGRLQNVRYEAGEVFADLKYIKAHPLAAMVEEIAAEMPESIGLSHDAQGSVNRSGGSVIVEEITSVRSVDLVADPASTTGLFESVQPSKQGTRKMTTTDQQIWNQLMACKVDGSPLSRQRSLTEMMGDSMMGPGDGDTDPLAGPSPLPDAIDFIDANRDKLEGMAPADIDTLLDLLQRVDKLLVGKPGTTVESYRESAHRRKYIGRYWKW